jgi:hypothetical protein
MRFTLPVIWSRDDVTRAGRLDAAGGRLTLSAREETFAFASGSIVSFTIDRAPRERLRGLPVLRLLLNDGQVLRIASLDGAGSLHELAARIGASQPAVSGT